jgi:hypothetical protein
MATVVLRAAAWATWACKPKACLTIDRKEKGRQKCRPFFIARGCLAAHSSLRNRLAASTSHLAPEAFSSGW